MKINLLSKSSFNEAMFGLGLSYGLTSDYKTWQQVPVETQLQICHVAEKLAGKGDGHDKFLRQITFIYDISAPMYWWPQFDQYKVGTVTQSESKMHTLSKREFRTNDFETDIGTANELASSSNVLLSFYLSQKNAGNKKEAETAWNKLLAKLPLCYIQRRIVSLNLAVMANIYKQRKQHKLKEWKDVCRQFKSDTPGFLVGVYE